MTNGMQAVLGFFMTLMAVFGWIIIYHFDPHCSNWLTGCGFTWYIFQFVFGIIIAAGSEDLRQEFEVHK